MKMLFSSPEGPEVGLVKNLLDEAGIPCEVRNENSYASFAGGSFCPELWVLDEADFPKAAELCDAWRKSNSAGGETWICPACGEKSEAQFSACWKCGAERKPVA